MANKGFMAFLLDQLSALPDVRARAMFGAGGLYQAGNFFAIVDEGRLCFKTDAPSQVDYVTRGMGAFTVKVKGRTVAMQYHEVPAEVLENLQELAIGARRAIGIPASGTQQSKARRSPQAPKLRSRKVA